MPHKSNGTLNIDFRERNSFKNKVIVYLRILVERSSAGYCTKRLYEAGFAGVHMTEDTDVEVDHGKPIPEERSTKGKKWNKVRGKKFDTSEVETIEIMSNFRSSNHCITHIWE